MKFCYFIYLLYYSWELLYYLLLKLRVISKYWIWFNYLKINMILLSFWLYKYVSWCNYRWRVWLTLKYWRDEYNLGFILLILKSRFYVFDLLFILFWELEIWFLFLYVVIGYNDSIVRFVFGLLFLDLLILIGVLIVCRVFVIYFLLVVGFVLFVVLNFVFFDY